MATALDVNWEAVKAHALVHGVRQAARDYGIDENTVKRRCTREGWLLNLQSVEQLPVTVRPRHVPGVPSPSEAQRKAMLRFSSRSRLNLAKAVDKGAKHVSKLEGVDILNSAKEIKALADTGDRIHQWSASSATPTLRLELIAGSQSNEPPVIDVESERL